MSLNFDATNTEVRALLRRAASSDECPICHQAVVDDDDDAVYWLVMPAGLSREVVEEAERRAEEAPLPDEGGDEWNALKMLAALARDGLESEAQVRLGRTIILAGGLMVTTHGGECSRIAVETDEWLGGDGAS